MLLRVLLCSLITTVAAFPHLRVSGNTLNPIRRVPSSEDNRVIPEWSPAQLVVVTGTHIYRDPLPGQARGPCPAQNALANHGYIDRSGFTNLVECVNANVEVFNMGPDFAGYLCFMGMLTGGDTAGITFSIGNSSAFDSSIKQSCSSSGLAGLILDLVCLTSKILNKALGTPGYGMAQTPNSFEAESSFLSADWQTINNLDASSRDANAVSQFWTHLLPDGTFDDSNIFIDWASYRKNQGIATNPCYFRAPQATLFASLGAYSLAHRLFSNYTPTNPGGTLTSSTLASFEGISVSTGTTPPTTSLKPFGREQIPQNWYKRPTPYTITEWLVNDYQPFYLRDPTLGSIGGNTNGVNTFTGVYVDDLTGGVINSRNLFDGDNFVCFYYRILQIDLLNKLPSAVGRVALGFGSTLGEVVDAVFGKMVKGEKGLSGCPKFEYAGVDGHKEWCGVRQQPGGTL